MQAFEVVLPSSRVAFILLCLTAAVCRAQYREAIDAAASAANVFSDLSSVVSKEEIGTFIRTAYKDGCLDAGCCAGITRQVRFNNECPAWGWLKWSFNGPMLVAHRPLFHSCLDCRDAKPDCVLTTTSCNGKHSQFWYLESAKNRKNDRGEMFFTIVNPMFPDRCVTVNPPCEDPDETQLFYISRNWINEMRRFRRDTNFSRLL